MWGGKLLEETGRNRGPRRRGETSDHLISGWKRKERFPVGKRGRDRGGRNGRKIGSISSRLTWERINPPGGGKKVFSKFYEEKPLRPRGQKKNSSTLRKSQDIQGKTTTGARRTLKGRIGPS